jgi:iron(III) transport system substrate-binding protein
MYKGKISAGRPDKSGSAYIQLALILQIYGEDKGWEIYQQASWTTPCCPTARAR